MSALEDHYFRPLCGGDYLATSEGQQDLRDHLSVRMTHDRTSVVPWLDAVQRLNGARILEIGCGTGASTVPLAEQGADVVAVDIHEGSMRAAQERCACYGVAARFVRANATEVHALVGDEAFDFIIFFASLEHMTLSERLEALRNAWGMLAPGKYLVVTDTPNRLWYYDHHTSFANFFLWLPDDLAVLYSRRTPRARFNTTFEALTDETRLRLSRLGRGVSFHDFELAFGLAADQLPVVSCLSLFLREKRGEERAHRRTLAGRYAALLQEVAPGIHRGFYERSLDLVFRKP